MTGVTRVQAQELKRFAESPAAGDLHGRSVAISGDVAVVGAPGDDPGGAVYVYYRDAGGDNMWGRVKRLQSSAATAVAFGSSVDIDGDRLVVGDPMDSQSADASGAAEIFVRDFGGADTWGLVKRIRAATPAAGAEFGAAVAVTGGRVAVGAPHSGTGGEAFVFAEDEGGADQWGQVAKITGSDVGAGDQFGLSVGLFGPNLVVGAPGDDAAGADAGAAYVFSRNEGGTDAWGELKKLVAIDGKAGDAFGFERGVAIDSDIAVVGAPGNDHAVDDMGSVYLFDKNRGGVNNWGLLKRIEAADASEGAQFGSAVALSGDYLMAGAWYDDERGSHAGAAYVFYKNRGAVDNWGQVTKIISGDAEADDAFGNAVGMSGMDAIVGAHGESEAGTDAGAAYLYGALTTSGACVATASRTVSAVGMIDFQPGPTGMDIDFVGTVGTERVIVERMNTAPLNTSGIPILPVYIPHWLVHLNDVSDFAFEIGSELRIDLDEIPLGPTELPDPSSVVVFQRAEYGEGSFAALATHYEAATNEIVASGFVSFSEFVLAGGGTLPVELVRLEVGRASSGGVVVRWETASEQGNLGWYVEHAALDGAGALAFRSLGFVAGAGSSLERNTYSYLADRLPPGTHRFRLRQVDADGGERLSQVVETLVELPEGILIDGPYPNPFNGRATLTFWSATAQTVRAVLYDVTGRAVSTLFADQVDANRPIRLQVESEALPSGVYLIRVTGPVAAAERTVSVVR